jgi:hypothetical protein
LEDNWIEVSEVWSRGELRDYTSLKGDAFVALWRRKVTAVNLVTVGGETIDEPGAVHDRLDDLDLRLLGFITAAPLEATSHLLVLGETNRRLSFVGTGAA